MLTSLRIVNFALIEEIQVDLGAGFNVITGETGAGKSILVDAVDLVLGGRASGEYIRSGRDKAMVEAIFAVAENTTLESALEELGIEVEDEELVLSREINMAGKNACRVNGRTVPLSLYREIGQLLVDIHGQHDHQSLLRQEKHLELLDGFDKSLVEGRLEIHNLYRAIQKEQEELDHILANQRLLLQQKDLYEYQHKEITQAGLVRGEEEQLHKDRRVLQNAEKIGTLSHEAYDLLYSGEAGGSALEKLDRVLDSLRELASFDADLMPLAETVENAYYQLEEAAREIGRYQQVVEYDPARLEEVENRLDQLNRLKKKYGNSVEEIIAYGEQVAASLANLEGSEESLDQRKGQLAELKEKYLANAGVLREKRSAIAARLEKGIVEELASLGMPHARFEVVFEKHDEPAPWGLDNVAFYISTNPGEPPKPLAKVASGGEVSRIMLALRSILAGTDQVGTIIFDEIDAGIGGRAAQAVAERLSRLGRVKQVFSVTHSPIIASYGHNHYFIEKEVAGDRTQTRLTPLDEPARVEEIGRILGGNNITPVTREQARQMLDLARSS